MKVGEQEYGRFLGDIETTEEPGEHLGRKALVGDEAAVGRGSTSWQRWACG